jgi:hypothetical protein
LLILLQFLLSRSRGVLPLLPESFAIDDAINRIVTQIWMDRLNQRMKLDGAEGPVALQQVDDRLREDCVTRTHTLAGAVVTSLPLSPSSRPESETRFLESLPLDVQPWVHLCAI